MKKIILITLFLFFILTFVVSAVEVKEGVIFRTTGSSCDYYMANDFSFTTITVYPTSLFMNTGNITTSPVSGWINMSMEILGVTNEVNFTNNASASSITIENGFAGFSITNGKYYRLKYQSTGAVAETALASSGEIEFTTISADSWQIKENSPVSLSVTTYYQQNVEGVVSISDTSSTDPDSDTPTYSCNRTDLFTDFDTATGLGSWTTESGDAGFYYIDLGVSDGYGSTDNETLTIEIVNETPSVPTNLQNTTSNFWINWTWSEGINTDHTEVRINGSWIENSSDTIYNGEYSAHAMRTISLRGYNSTWASYSSYVNQTVTIPNNLPTTPVLISPTDGNYTTDTTPYLNWSDSTDLDSDSLTYHLYIDNESSFSYPFVYSNTSLTDSNTTLITPLDDGLYYWRLRVYDTYEYSPYATHFNFTVDTTLPLIIIDDTVLNTTSYYKTPISLNYTVTEANLNRTWYNVTNTTGVIVANTTLTANTTFNVSADGEYNLTIYADDLAGYENSTNLTFKADITAPTITNTASGTQALVGEPVTISATINDTYSGVESAKVRIENPRGYVSNYTMTGLGDSYSYTYEYTGVVGTYYIRYFYAWDNSTGSNGNFREESSSLTFATIPYTHAPGGGGGGSSGYVTLPNETVIERFTRPIHFIEEYYQRIFFYKPFTNLTQPRAYLYKADKPVISCNSSIGECRAHRVDNTTLAVIYSPEDDDFWVKSENINITVFDADGYRDFGELDLIILNLGAYIPVKIPIKIGRHEVVNYFFKIQLDSKNDIYIVGLRAWWVLISLLSTVIVIIYMLLQGGERGAKIKHEWIKDLRSTWNRGLRR